jgi:uncharacterized Zn-binding protein involved in type VI secretion
MGLPAARTSDMHTCPMQTPVVFGTIPHVGGPILVGVPNVLIGSLPAAVMGTMCICVGPPDVIVMGSTGVLIGGRPAARMSDNTAHGGIIVGGLPTVLIGGNAMNMMVGVGGLEGALGDMFNLPTDSPLADPAVVAMIAQSPTLTSNLAALQADGWSVRYGVAGAGTTANRDTKVITIDPNQRGNAPSMVQSLAHESGHAMYTLPPQVPTTGLTRDQYVSQNAQRHLDDEGEATLTNAQVRQEIINNGGSDIGIAGTQTPAYQQSYQDYQTHGDRQRARREIGNTYADNEHPSNDVTHTYRDYYSTGYRDYYNANPPTTP